MSSQIGSLLTPGQGSQSDTPVVCTPITETTSARLQLCPEVFPLLCFHCLLLYTSGMSFSAACGVVLLFTILPGITTHSDCPG